MIGQIVLLLVFILLSAVFSSTEIAMFSLSELRIRHLMEQKVRNAKLLFKLKKDSHKLLITILLGNNIANIGAASIATSLAIGFFGNYGVGIATGVMTLIILVAGEISPKALATKYKQKIALRMTPLINIFMKIFYPLVWLFDKMTSLIVAPNQDIGPLITEEEVRDILKLSEEQGSIKEQEEEMIQNIFKLDDTTAEDVMTARPDVLSYEENKKVDEVLSEIVQKGYSRIPIYKKDLDNITGLLYAKDLLAIDPKTSLKEIKRPVFFVLDSKRVDILLREFKQKKMHMAIVVNEHGTMVGVVTIEDLIEEIIGEIYDETDEEPQAVEEIKLVRTNEYIMSGFAELEDVEEELGIEFNDEDHSTLSGWITHRLGRIPKVHDECNLEHWSFTVKKMQGKRVKTVHVQKI